jgi:Zn-dependent protease
MTDGVVTGIVAQHSLRAAVAEVMAVEDVTEGVPTAFGAILRRGQPRAATTASPSVAIPGEMGYVPTRQGDALRFRGRLTWPSDQAYERLAQRFAALGYTPVLRKDDDRLRDVVLAVPGTLRKANQRLGIAALLFCLTLVSCLFAGAQMVEGLTSVNWNLLQGLPYAASLLAILTAHELGHYFTARRLGSPTSLPYFIPMPFGFGTLGAVINMVAPPRDRRRLLAIAVAGPLAGLAVAIPVLLVGLRLSRIEPLPASGPYSMEGNSLLYAGLKYIVFGQVLPSNGVDVFIHQVAFAGWAGLLVTGLNLIPAGQLDGGHVVYAMFGEKIANVCLWVVLAVLSALAFLWQGWIIWVVLIFFLGRMRAEPLDDLTQLTGKQQALALLVILIFFLVFTPIPMRVVTG